MAKKKRKKIASRGSVNDIILKTLVGGDKYGYEIIKEVENYSDGKIILKQPSLYSSLTRFEEKGYVSSYWGVYAGVASSAALTLLRNSGIAARCDLEVPHIINRKGDGICPVEQLCLDCATAAECLPRIEQFMQQLKQQNDASN